MGKYCPGDFSRLQWSFSKGNYKTRVISLPGYPMRKSELTPHPFSPKPAAAPQAEARRPLPAPQAPGGRSERDAGPAPDPRGPRMPAPAKSSVLGPSRGSGRRSGPAAADEAIFCPPEKAPQRTWRPEGAGGGGVGRRRGLRIEEWRFPTLPRELPVVSALPCTWLGLLCNRLTVPDRQNTILKSLFVILSQYDHSPFNPQH